MVTTPGTLDPVCTQLHGTNTEVTLDVFNLVLRRLIMYCMHLGVDRLMDPTHREFWLRNGGGIIGL